MKTLFRILGTAAAVAVTGAAIVVLDKILNQKDPLHVEEVEFPEEAEKDTEEAAKTAEAYERPRPRKRPKAADAASRTLRRKPHRRLPPLLRSRSPGDPAGDRRRAPGVRP
ncbi:MAG: hypothetical protein ACLVJH_05150 [Faecalibacterium prausnitzii]